MTSHAPTYAQCLAASAHLPLQKKGRRVPVYLAQILKPLSRMTAGSRSHTCEGIPHVLAGAMLIAAGMNRPQMNAAINAASVALHLYDTDTEQDPFPEVVNDLALCMLRAGWRSDITHAEKQWAMSVAEVEAATGVIVVFAEADDEQAQLQAENNAAWEAVA